MPGSRARDEESPMTATTDESGRLGSVREHHNAGTSPAPWYVDPTVGLPGGHGESLTSETCRASAEPPVVADTVTAATSTAPMLIARARRARERRSHGTASARIGRATR